jgi:hypothetical protein
LHTFSRRSWIVSGSVALMGLAIGVPWRLLSRDRSQAGPPLRIDRARISDGSRGVGAPRPTVVPDDLRQKYSPTRRVELHVACSKGTSIFLLATGVQVPTPSGWQMVSEEYRGEIWRLKPGVAREVCVERPEAGRWRAYIRYGTEMKGLPLITAQLREAWLSRSLSNWTGKAWGGGRWSGTYELFSDEIIE